MNFTEETMQTQTIAYMRRTGAYGGENYELMKSFKAWMQKEGYYKSDAIIYAIARDNPEKTDPQNCRYDVGMTVPEDFRANGVELSQIADGKYLIFMLDHTAKAVGEFYSSFFTVLTKNNYRLDLSRSLLERYPISLINQNLCQLCVPIL